MPKSKATPKEARVQVDIDVREPIVVSVQMYRGKFTASVRHHYWAKGGELLPSPRGIAFPAENLQELIDALTQLQVEADLPTATED